MTVDEYVYEIINNKNDARLCAELIAEEFSAHNPLTMFEKQTPVDFFKECSWPLMAELFDERLSFLVRYRSSGEIVGAVIAGDLYRYHHRHSYDASCPPNANPIFDLLDEMDNVFITKDFRQELKPNLVLQIQLTAISSKHSGKGITSQLNAAMISYAQNEKGFKYVFTQATNPVTRHIYVNKMGGKEVTIIDPTTWIWKKKSDQLSYPFKDYTCGSIPNILIEIKSDRS